MDAKVANRYVKLLSYVIDVKVRKEGKDATVDRNEIFAQIDDLTDKTFKQMIEWFTERNIFDKIGNTYSTRYKLHPSFQYKISKSKEIIKKQSQFIIGQLAIYSDMLWDEAENLYKDIVMNTNRFDFMPTIKEKIVKETFSSLMMAEYNDENEGVYPLELLQRLTQLKSPFDIKIKNKNLNVSMKEITIKGIKFNTNSITLKFNNATFDIDDVLNIKSIHIPIQKDIRDRIDRSLEILNRYDSDEVKPIIELMNRYKIKEDLFFQ